RVRKLVRIDREEVGRLKGGSVAPALGRALGSSSFRVYRGILHKDLIRVGAPEVAPPTIKFPEPFSKAAFILAQAGDSCTPALNLDDTLGWTRGKVVRVEINRAAAAENVGERKKTAD
ncbi:hypothetical protein GW17_00003532, partial [Ensete ventricosum]